MNDNGNNPAFPRERMAEGLTKREYFAGLAMQALITDKDTNPSIAAMESLCYADALLKELEDIPSE